MAAMKRIMETEEEAPAAASILGRVGGEFGLKRMEGFLAGSLNPRWGRGSSLNNPNFD